MNTRFYRTGDTWLDEWMNNTLRAFTPRYQPEWKSKDDPAFRTPRKLEPSKPTDANNLPSGRWVVAAYPSDRQERVDFKIGMSAWLLERNSKYQRCVTLINGVPTKVFLFKKKSEALLFKLTWG